MTADWKRHRLEQIQKRDEITELRTQIEQLRVELQQQRYHAASERERANSCRREAEYMNERLRDFELEARAYKKLRTLGVLLEVDSEFKYLKDDDLDNMLDLPHQRRLIEDYRSAKHQKSRYDVAAQLQAALAAQQYRHELAQQQQRMIFEEEQVINQRRQAWDRLLNQK